MIIKQEIRNEWHFKSLAKTSKKGDCIVQVQDFGGYQLEIHQTTGSRGGHRYFVVPLGSIPDSLHIPERIEVDRQVGKGKKPTILKSIEEAPLKSVTASLSPVEGSPNGLVWWAAKLAAESGNASQHQFENKKTIDIGNQLHEDIENFINNNVVAENPLFVAWYKAVGEPAYQEGGTWLGTEVFTYDPTTERAGTLDAVYQAPSGEVTLYDWKTKNTKSYYDHNPFIKDHVQAFAYCWSLWNTMSPVRPDKMKVVYIMRDEDHKVEIAEVPLHPRLAATPQEPAGMLKYIWRRSNEILKDMDTYLGGQEDGDE